MNPRHTLAGAAVVVVGDDAGSTPAARLATALRERGATVVAVADLGAGRIDAACESAAAEGRFEVVVHTHVPPGALCPGDLVELDDAGWAGIVDASVLATLTTLQAARRHLGRGGRVLVVLPAVGLVGAAGHAALCAAAEAQRALAKSAARAWGAAGITVNVLAAELGELGWSGPSPAAVQAPALAAGGTGDGGDDLVSAALVLLATEAGRTTGVTLVADAGGTMLP